MGWHGLGGFYAGELITDKGNVHFRYKYRTAKQLMANRIMHLFLDFTF